MLPTDEARHRAPTVEAETWCFEFVGEAIAGYASLTLWASRRVAWYWSAIVGDRWPLVTVVDLDVRMPRTLEIRADGLWADHICETPWEHWTVANETYAVLLSDPSEALGAARGVPTPMAFDLEWEAATPAQSVGSQYYEVGATVHGEVLLGPERLEVDGRGRWWHRWGSQQWAAPSDGPRPDGRRAPVPLVVDGLKVDLEAVLADGWWTWWTGGSRPA